MKKTIILALVLLSSVLSWGADTRVSSPDGRMVITIHTDANQLSWEVSHDGVVVLTTGAQRMSQGGIYGVCAEVAELLYNAH